MNKFRSLLTGLLLLGAASVAHAGPIELLTNGDFEAGSFVGWTVSTSGGSSGATINNGSYNPLGDTGANAPIGGFYDAVFDQGGPGVATIFDLIISLPTTTVTSAIFSWDHIIENHHSSYFLPAAEGGAGFGQLFRALVTDGAGTTLVDAFTSTAANTTFGVLQNNSVDLTTFVNANLGATIGIQFENRAEAWFMTTQLDNASFLVDVSSVPEPGVITLLCFGLVSLLSFHRKSYG